MLFNYSTVDTFKPDLRTPKSIIIQRGLAIRLLQIFTLIVLDTSSIIFGWKLAILNTSLETDWEIHSYFLLLIIAIELSIIGATGMYQPNRRNYLGLFTAISLTELILLMMTALYEPNQYILRYVLLLFGLFSIVFIYIGRLIFDAVMQFIHNKGIVSYPVLLITDTQEQADNIKLIEQENCYNIQVIASSSALEKS
ncbi:MAG: hypothetical protein HC908_13930 [Calothrix sp. SM1_7_51]|nr:hypothetical protein [Calothrix sp. SM1_7_51]